MPHVNCSSYGQLDPEAAHGDLRERVPVVVQRRVDVYRDSHRLPLCPSRWCRAGVLDSMRAPGHGLARRRPPRRQAVDYADGAYRSRPAATPSEPPLRTATITALNVYGPSGRSPWLDIDWREHQRWVSANGQPVNTIDLGEGPPIVFVHGLSGSWPNWLEQLPVFAAEHRVVAMDLPGFGHSPMPHERITISSYARLLDGLLDELGIDAATIVGNSMGGFVSAESGDRVPAARRAPGARLSRGPQHLPRTARDARAAERCAASNGCSRVHGLGCRQADAITGRPGLRKATLSDLVRPSRPAGSRARGRAGARRRQARVHAGAGGEPRLRLP